MNKLVNKYCNLFPLFGEICGVFVGFPAGFIIVLGVLVGDFTPGPDFSTPLEIDSRVTTIAEGFWGRLPGCTDWGLFITCGAGTDFVGPVIVLVGIWGVGTGVMILGWIGTSLDCIASLAFCACFCCAAAFWL